MRYDLNKLEGPLTQEDLSRFRDLAKSGAGRELARDLAESDAGWALSRELVESGTGAALARDLADSGAVRELARDLFRNNPGWTLALALAKSNAGRDFAVALAGSGAGRDLVLAVVGSGAGVDLALELAGRDTGVDLARGLAESDAGEDLARDLVGSGAGRNLARDLAGSGAGLALARGLARSDAGRTLAVVLARSVARRRDLALDLAESDAGRDLALELAGSGAGQGLALDLARSGAGRILARTLAESDAGRAFVLHLARSGAGQGVARTLAESDAGQAFARSHARSGAGQGLAQALYQSGVGEFEGQPQLTAAVTLLLVTGSIPTALVMMSSVEAASMVLFVAGALTRTDEEADTDEVSDEDDGGEPARREVVEVLEGEARQVTKSALEPSLGVLERIIADPVVTPDPEIVDYLRRQLNTINDQLGGSRPDRFIVERGIRLIVEELANLGHVGDGARYLLEELGAKPPELIDTIVTGLQAFVESFEVLGDPEALDPAGAIEQMGRQVEELNSNVDTALPEPAPDSPTRGTQITRASVRIGKLVATGAVTGAGGFVGKLAVETLYRQLNIDEFLLRLAEAIQQFWQLWAPFV